MANNVMGELGSTGLVQFSGQIQSDFLRELRGKEGYKRYLEMSRNSPIIGALLLANEQAIRKVSWYFESDIENDPRVEFLEEALEGMSHSWNDHIIEALTMLQFGFSMFEIVYQRDERGRITWRKFAPRGQNTVYQWQFDTTGGLSGVRQQAAPVYQVVDIPIEKLIIYRTRVESGNPEGRSILRTAWIPYYYVKHIQQVEAIGIERDLAGLPVLKLPEGADTSDNDESDAGKAEKIVRNIRNDEQAGLVLPFGWEAVLLSTGGSRQFDTDKIIRRYESRMLVSALAQFLNLGQEAVGSLALSKDQTDFFTMSVNALADIISETVTKYAAARLLQLNGFDPAGVKLAHSPAGDTDVNLLADTLQKIGSYLTWMPEDEAWLRDEMHMPEIDTATIQAERDAKAAQARAIADAIAAKGQGTQDGNQNADGAPMDKGKADKSMMEAFAASAPDDAARRRMERKLKQLIADHNEKTRRKVLKYAKANHG